MASAPMMFDTCAYAQRLRGAGFGDAQVEAMTTGLSDIAMAQVATTRDVADAVATLRAEMREMEQRIVIRIVGAMVVVATLATAVAKIL